ncbi:MAG: RraA family protein [Chloroflexi bacterium]|nr:MAG: RraA family protein [Chloroflexota bacterium]
MKITDARLQLLLDAGTAVIADVFDAMRMEPPVLDTALFPVNRTGFIGPAYTIAGETHTGPATGDRAKLSAIDEMPPGVVALWAGGDIRGVCCFGDLLATAMQARGCAGVVVDGGVRDVAYLRRLDLPVVARYRTPAQAIGRWRVVSRQEPVRVRGALRDWVTVHPGDLIAADEDGVVVIPAGLAAEVAERVQAWTASESGAREDIRRGMPLLKALDRYGHL